MSVIQEALKKAEHGISDTKDVRPEQMVFNQIKLPEFVIKIGTFVLKLLRPNDTHNNRSALVIGLFVVIIFALITLAIALPGPANGSKRLIGRSSQRVIYRDIARNGASISGGISGRIRSVALVLSRPKLMLNGIMYLVDRPRAILNDYIVEVGDIVEGAEVTEINPNSVILEHRDTEITISLK